MSVQVAVVGDELISPLLPLGFPNCSVGKEPTCNPGDPSSIPGLGRSTEEGTGYTRHCSLASLVAQLVKNLPAVWETWIQPLGWEDPLAKGKANHSSILAWRIPWTVSPWGRKESDTTEQLSLSLLPLVKMEHLTNTFHCPVEITSAVFHGHIKPNLSENKFSVFSFLPFFTLTFLPSFRRTR